MKSTGNHPNLYERYGEPSAAPWPEYFPTGVEARQATRQAPPQTRRPRMPKGEARALVRKLKRGIVVTILVCFGAFSGLVMSRTNADANQQTTPGDINQLSPNQTQDTTNSQWQRGGYGFGNDNQGQGPVSRSHAS